MKDRRGRELSKEKIEHYIINIQRGAHELKGSFHAIFNLLIYIPT